MLFHSPEFIFLFLPTVLFGFHILSRLGATIQHIWLVASSLFFYGTWRLNDVAVLMALMTITFVISMTIAHKKSKILLMVGIGSNLIALAYFKYTGFFLGIAKDISGIHFQISSIALPLGISFFVFQKIAYLVDTHQNRTIRHSVLDYVLFVSFFPQLIAGPIVHQGEMLRQFRSRVANGLQAQDLAIGLTLFSFGLFKKIVLADSFAGLATPVFTAAEAGNIDCVSAWIGALAYSFQIYFDFSGYTDMAIGLGRMFGIRLPINFNSPYKSLSIIEFWRRWHITLSRFLRDYLYIPLGGNRHGQWRWACNLMTVMLLGGLWHGAAWTFVIWGGLHGFGLVVNHLWRRYGRTAFPSLQARSLAWLATFLVVVIAWVFFRAPNVTTALHILWAMTTPTGSITVPIDALGWLILGLLITTQLPNTQQIMARGRPALGAVRVERNALLRRISWSPTAAWAVGSGVVFLLGIARYWTLNTPPEFIYFNF